MKQVTYFPALLLGLLLTLPGASMAQAALAAEPASIDMELKLAGQQLSNNDFAACIPSY